MTRPGSGVVSPLPEEAKVIPGAGNKFDVGLTSSGDTISRACCNGTCVAMNVFAAGDTKAGGVSEEIRATAGSRGVALSSD